MSKPLRMPVKDMIGKVFGELTILADAGVAVRLNGKAGDHMVDTRCSCGVEKSMQASLIQSGRYVSCGHVKKMKFTVSMHKGAPPRRERDPSTVPECLRRENLPLKPPGKR